MTSARARNGCGASVRENSTVMNCNDPIGIAEHDIHVVLYLDDGLDSHLPRRLNEDTHDRRFVGGAHTACRLVEQNDLRTERKCAGDIQQLLVALRQDFRRLIQFAGKSKDSADALNNLPHRPIARSAGKKPFPVTQMRDGRHRDGFTDAQFGKDVDELERARHAQAGKPHGAEIDDIVSLERHVSGGRPHQPRQHVDQRGLSGAIRSDDGYMLAVVDRQSHVVERAKAAVEFPHVLRLQ